MRTSLEQEILDLKKKHNALILAHYYEDGEIQDIADAVGDSLYLAQQGKKAKEDIILLSGVVFMAESVKILSPNKKVIVPDVGAGCSLVNESPYDEYLAWRKKFPEHISVTYVNCSAKVKSITDVICTSSNAEKIIAAIPKDRGILFGPDKNLGRYLAKKSGHPMEIWQGSCEVHILFSAKELHKMKLDNPGAIVIAHPECDDGVLALSDVIGSTSRLLTEVEKNPAKKFIVATEDGIFHQMKKLRPDAEILQAPTADACGCNQCPYMKLNSLEKVRDALLAPRPDQIVTLEEGLRQRAARCIERMFELTPAD